MARRAAAAHEELVGRLLPQGGLQAHAQGVRAVLAQQPGHVQDGPDVRAGHRHPRRPGQGGRVDAPLGAPVRPPEGCPEGARLARRQRVRAGARRAGVVAAQQNTQNGAVGDSRYCGLCTVCKKCGQEVSRPHLSNYANSFCARRGTPRGTRTRRAHTHSRHTRGHDSDQCSESTHTRVRARHARAPRLTEPAKSIRRHTLAPRPAVGACGHWSACGLRTVTCQRLRPYTVPVLYFLGFGHRTRPEGPCQRRSGPTPTSHRATPPSPPRHSAHPRSSRDTLCQCIE